MIGPEKYPLKNTVKRDPLLRIKSGTPHFCQALSLANMSPCPFITQSVSE